MARLKTTNWPKEFSALHEDTKKLNETNDCAVKAVALATGKPYAEVHAVMKALGRADRKGTPNMITEATLKHFGFRFRKWGFIKHQQLIKSYPGVHAGLHSITTHHPRRFPEAWASEANKVLLLASSRHILCYRDGEIKDWSINRSLRIRDIYEIEV